MSKKVELGVLIDDMSSEEYHSTPDTHSSTQIKMVLNDPEMYKKIYITKEAERPSSSAFDIGTYFHTAILEPHLLASTTAIFEGFRRGDKWEAFKKKHKGKTLITSSEVLKAKNLIEGVRASKRAMEKLANGYPEMSLFVKLSISDKGGIYAPDFGKMLTRYGWKDCPEIPKGFPVTVKVRADLLGPDFILDLKSCSGDTHIVSDMIYKNMDYGYLLSASLYVDMFNLVMDNEIKEFIWTYSSKDKVSASNYSAHMDRNNTLQCGRGQWVSGLRKLKKLVESNWEIAEEIVPIDPHYSEMKYLEIIY
jgi:hypothetical protein